ncbi:energy-coupling factor transporter transmembrane component T family protein [Streptococcus saliviloxodontae]|uniref:Energy-coupling factor transport system permease protein n=1 Tax=Streptococcus saliviloxodontae TaxID=1349416 RepID=A0ABS2PP24_9STRE|nr:energy-coupling factor transporter transmembrane component T [Streptococcus saliviloxodontae]MBM7636856.1 energy-coupling factor transport system permease protein [Streptococcus saliviloxodontae]
MSNRLIGYQQGQGFLYRLSGASKLIFFILVSVACMATYDTRFILLMGVLAMYLFYQAKIRWKDISFVINLILIVAIFNLMMVYLFSPSYGAEIYGRKDLVISGWGYFSLSYQELFYLFNLLLKYFCTVPLAILFLMTTHPSQFAASLNQIGVSYRISYAVSLTLRYIPDIQEEFYTIRRSQEARGLELSKKAGLISRIRGNLQIALPLILSSLERIDTVSTAMELRRFGKNKKRTWYNYQAFKKADWLTLLLAISLLLLSLALIWVNQGRFYNPWA